MEFLTLHELSVQFDTSVRVLRHRLRQLLAEGKLVEGRDCRRDDYVDPTHFVWRVNPIAFMQTTGLKPVDRPATQDKPPGSSADNHPQPTATQPSPSRASQPQQTLPKVDTPPPQPPGMEREMIDLLKEQVRTKDTHIVQLTDQNKTLTALNEKLTGVVVHQSNEIRSLLRLTGGKTNLSEMATKPDNPAATGATHADTKPADRADILDSHLADEGGNAVGEQAA